MARETWNSQVIETIDGMFNEGQNNISVRDILTEHYRGKGAPPPRTSSQIQTHLPAFRKILHDVLHYDINIIGNFYFVEQRYRGVNNIDQGKMCLPTRAKNNKAWGLHVRTKGNDWIWLADVQRNKALADGGEKNAVDRVIAAYNNRDISQLTAAYLLRVENKYKPILPINSKMLSETGRVNDKWEWLQDGKKDVQGYTHSADDEEEIA